MNVVVENVRKKSFDNPLVAYIKNYFPLSKEVENFIVQNTIIKVVRRNKFLLKPGEICNHYYYINKGLLRAYIKYGTKEITTWINPENEITTSIKSMSIREPSEEYIQALEDSELICMEHDKMEEMYIRFPEMNFFGRRLLQAYYADSEERAFICRIPNGEVRYLHFVKTRPELINRISLKYIASYLGMSHETLSRLRSKKSL